jgi:hypothetical protein
VDAVSDGPAPHEWCEDWDTGEIVWVVMPSDHDRLKPMHVERGGIPFEVDE